MNKIKSRHIWILIVLVMLLFTPTHGQSAPVFNKLSSDSTKILEQHIYDNSLGDVVHHEYDDFRYFVKDHLGNNRVVNNGSTVYQRTHYYPFGGPYADVGTAPDYQPYKYNGKELDRMHGLDLYDYGFRHYDPIVPMFTQQDPMAEK